MSSKLMTQIKSINKHRLYVYIVILVISLIYIMWWAIRKPDIQPGQVISAAPAKAVKSEPVEYIKPKQVIVYRDTIRVVEKMGLPPAQPQEKVQTTAEIPRLKYGGTSTVFLNMSTGQSRTVLKANEAPWIAFRNDLAIGAGAGIGTEGKTLAGRIRYDILQIKGVTVTPELEGNYSENRKHPVEGRVMVWSEYRW